MAVTTKEFFTEPVEELKLLQAGTGLSAEFDVLLQELAEHGFAVAVGAHLSQQPYLEAMSLENGIREFCPGDIAERFGSVAMMRGWQSEGAGRVMVGIYAVNDHEGPLGAERLAGLRAEDVTQVAYGWFGSTPVKAMPKGVSVTLAFRVGMRGQELARRRSVPERRLRMGLALAQAVLGVATDIYGIERRRIGLDSWRSNHRANALYRELGFRVVAARMGERPRPTLEAAGNLVDGRMVRYNGKHNEVWDERLYQVLATDEELEELAREAEAEAAEASLS